MATSIFDRAKGVFSRTPPVVADKAPTVVAKKITQAFHAVSILPGIRCCHQARTAGPALSFAGGTVVAAQERNCGSCTCHYEHHDDRRARPRRARDMGVAIRAGRSRGLR